MYRLRFLGGSFLIYLRFGQWETCEPNVLDYNLIDFDYMVTFLQDDKRETRAVILTNSHTRFVNLSHFAIVDLFELA